MKGEWVQGLMLLKKALLRLLVSWFAIFTNKLSEHFLREMQSEERWTKMAESWEGETKMKWRLTKPSPLPDYRQSWVNFKRQICGGNAGSWGGNHTCYKGGCWDVVREMAMRFRTGKMLELIRFRLDPACFHFHKITWCQNGKANRKSNV